MIKYVAFPPDLDETFSLWTGDGHFKRYYSAAHYCFAALDARRTAWDEYNSTRAAIVLDNGMQDEDDEQVEVWFAPNKQEVVNKWFKNIPEALAWIKEQ